MKHVPMCRWCGVREVQIVADSDGSGYCSAGCENENAYQDMTDNLGHGVLFSKYDDDHISRYDTDPAA